MQNGVVVVLGVVSTKSFLQEAFSECFRVSRGVLGAGVSMAADTFVSVTCGAEGRVATYLSDVRLLFVDKASPSAFAPSSWILFPAKL